MSGIDIKWSKEDIDQIGQLGISVEQLEAQIESFKKGFPFIDLDRPCTPGDGIKVLDDASINKYIKHYETEAPSKEVIKFVPASGAASRMFKELYSFIEKDSEEADGYDICDQLDDFAFAEEVKKLVGEGASRKSIAEAIVEPKGLNYGNLPKGLIQFHQYEKESRTAFEEHLVEAAEYARGKENIARVHFTVSPEHMEKVKELMQKVLAKYEERYDVTYEVTYSVQKKSTDTVAVDTHDEPFREDNGQILFRPGGHGALIENLGALDGDLIFVKNIDNVVPDHLKEETYKYKKALGGYLLSIQEQCFKHLDAIESGKFDSNNAEILEFIEKGIGLPTSPSWNETDVIRILNRPIRVCGMVKNEGEPGGGPFWVKGPAGRVSHQIVESSQMDLTNNKQLEIMKASTHFNPVDLVCSTKDYRGNRFDLHKFVDPETGFISMKSKNGRDLKALELPGLWNGAMAKWITLFVDVPVITFNPVKTIRDLLRDTHQ